VEAVGHRPVDRQLLIGHVEEVYTNEEIGTIIRVKDGSGAVAPFFPEEIVSIAPTDPVSYFRWKWVI